MFGFLNPRPHSLDYRRAYARLCQHQRRQYGFFTLPFHSYEGVFLYQYAVDAAAFPSSCMPHVRCCRLASPSSLMHSADTPWGRFSASVAVLLTSIKLQDDIRDSRSLLARSIRWVLRRRIAQAQQYFQQLDPRFNANVQSLIRDHHLLEQSSQTIALKDYVMPTEYAFGYVFSLMAKLPGMSQHEKPLQQIGRHVGASLIAFDCAVDWQRDRQRGEFNPLENEEAVRSALVWSAKRLHQAEQELTESLGPEALTVTTLKKVRRRVELRDPLSAPVSCPTPRQVFLHNVRRIPLTVYASSTGPSNLPVSGANAGSNRTGKFDEKVSKNRKTSGRNNSCDNFCEAYCCAEGCCLTCECIACMAN